MPKNSENLVNQVILKGHIIVPESDLEPVQQALAEHIKLTQEESGCVFFQVTASDISPYRFEVHEIFESQSAFEHHQERVKNSYWRQVTQNVARHYVITESPARSESA